MTAQRKKSEPENYINSLPPNENMKVWDTLGETDPNYTKPITGKNFNGTAINPTYCYKKLTSVFGPAGKGWYFEVTKTEVRELGKEIFIFKEVSLFVKYDDEWSKPIVGHGGEKLVSCFKVGTPQEYLRADDEATKKCLTDAYTNAMKMLGMSSDIHMGEYDDNKYVNSLKEKYADEPNPPKQASPATASSACPFGGDSEKRKAWLASACAHVLTLKAALDVSQWETINAKFITALGDKQKAYLQGIVTDHRSKIDVALNDEIPWK